MSSQVISDKAVRRQTTRSEQLAMVTFLEEPDNFKLLTGGAANGKSVLAGQKLTKNAGYQELASFVNAIITDKERIWNSSNAKSRYTSYYKQYKTAKNESSQTGWGIDSKDTANGIETVAAKLEAMCPFYERLDKLFGHRQNVTPAIVAEVGVPSDFFPSPAYQCESYGYDDPYTADEYDYLDDDEVVEEGLLPSREGGLPPRPLCTPGANSQPSLSSTPAIRSSAEVGVRSRLQAKRLRFDQPTSGKKDSFPKSAKRDFASTYAELQTEQILFDREKLQKDSAMQERLACLEESKAERLASVEEQKLKLEIQKFEQASALARQVAKATMVASLLQSGQSLESIQETLKLVFTE
jgi:hypothetical protein